MDFDQSKQNELRTVFLRLTSTSTLSAPALPKGNVDRGLVQQIRFKLIDQLPLVRNGRAYAICY